MSEAAGTVSFQVAGLIPTLLVVAALGKPAAFSKALAAAILDRSGCEPGTTASNIGGWYSSELLSWCGMEGAAMIDAARDIVARMTLMDSPAGPLAARLSWGIAARANVNRAGDGRAEERNDGLGPVLADPFDDIMSW